MQGSAVFARASIRNGGLALSHPHPAMLRGSAAAVSASHARRLGAAVCDLHEEVEPGFNRLFVNSIGCELSAAHRAVIIHFASNVGYHELWVDDRGDRLCLELEGGVPVGQSASVECPTCAFRMENSSADFWIMVHSRRRFPDLCQLCGGHLPQWTVAPAEPLGPEEGELRAELNGMAEDRWSAQVEASARVSSLLAMPIEDLTADELRERGHCLGEFPDPGEGHRRPGGQD